MILYHGSTIIVEKPEIIRAEYGRDFGFGFYTTDIKEQAIRWAKRKAKVSSRNGATYLPYISIYAFDDQAFDILKVRRFFEPSLDWLDMVCDCRSNISYEHGYDIVEGKIADDNVGETVTYVVRGIMRKEDAVEKLKFEEINNQICFNTSRALEFIKYIGYEECR